MTNDKIKPLNPARTVIKPYKSQIWHAAVANEHGNNVPLCCGSAYWWPDYLHRDKFHTDISVTCGNCVRTRYWKDFLKPLIDSQEQLAENRNEKAVSGTKEDTVAVKGLTPDHLDLLSSFSSRVAYEMNKLMAEGFSLPTNIVIHHEQISGEVWVSVNQDGKAIINLIA